MHRNIPMNLELDDTTTNILSLYIVTPLGGVMKPNQDQRGCSCSNLLVTECPFHVGFMWSQAM